MKCLLALALLLIAAHPAPPPEVLAHSIPPIGAMSPLVTQDNLASTVCAPAPSPGAPTWIHRQRPPTSWTNRLKRELFRRIGIPNPTAAQMRSVEGDHAIAIQDGGLNAAPADPRHPTQADVDRALTNFWLQPWNAPMGATSKDMGIEDTIHAELCGSHGHPPTITLSQVPAEYARWRAAYIAQMPGLPTPPAAHLHPH